MKKLVIVFSVLTVSLSCKKESGSQGENFTDNVNKVANSIIDDSSQLTFFDKSENPIEHKFENFPTGSVLPKGWILNMMKQDLEKGMVGALEHLYPGIKSDDLYNSARRGGMEDIPEMGDLVLTGAAWEKSIMWWNAETIGNWWDGFIRHAFLTQNDRAIKQSREIVLNLMNSQDEDGYIGIYKPNLRYQHEGSNGELWAQTTAFRSMLAYYEFTNDAKVLKSVERAMQLTMKKYGEEGKNPFHLKNAFGGVTHGLMLTDVCETLHRITKNQAYQDYATYLYKAFSTYSINRSFNDLRYPYLKEKDSLFEGHGVHTYEHIRTMVNAYFNTGYPELENAYNNMLSKLEPCLLTSGAGHADEWILKLKADPSHTASEYCSMLELRNSYGSLIQKTGDVAFADAAEKLTFNAMLGARNKEGTAITYSKFDNAYVIDGKHHKDGHSKNEPRYKYSPTHSEPAVCCVPNYGRNLSYFLDQMWMKHKDGVAALMFGPSQLNTKINGASIRITQETNYPFSDEVTFKISTDRPVEFTFFLRKPNWSSEIDSNLEFTNQHQGYLAIRKEWRNGDSFTIQFKNDVMIHKASNEESFVQRGPLVYAFPIEHSEEVVKTYDIEGFKDYHCFPKNQDHLDLKLIDNPQFELKKGATTDNIYTSELELSANFRNSKTNKKEKINLIPMGKTVLRRVTFPQK
ncbi:MAG: hypothetical protein CMB99_09600 [Flavobacteriaceae bacterium]|nr:hypothetical protein [Flavobacteriaceae bacterium]|tara:strand:+ start:411349 stop:413412 length:2064 start_codon:yes stop_codon:yes gene_type:complete